MRLIKKKTSKNIQIINKNKKIHNINRVIYMKVKILIIKYKNQKKLIHLNNNKYNKEINIIKKKAIQKYS